KVENVTTINFHGNVNVGSASLSAQGVEAIIAGQAQFSVPATLLVDGQIHASGNIALTANDFSHTYLPFVHIHTTNTSLTLNGAQLSGQDITVNTDANSADIFSAGSAASSVSPTVEVLANISDVGGVSLANADAELHVNTGTTIVGRNVSLGAT